MMRSQSATGNAGTANRLILTFVFQACLTGSVRHAENQNHAQIFHCCNRLHYLLRAYVTGDRAPNTRIDRESNRESSADSRRVSN